MPSSDYYSSIDKAEMSVVDNNLVQANKHYKKSLFNCKGCFASDYFSAFKVAWEIRDLEFANYNASKLIEKGMPLHFFEQYELIKNDTQRWDELISMANKNRFINNKYRRELELMFDDDQCERSIKSHDRSHIAIVDSINFIKFKNLVTNNGFPSESSIGIESTINNTGIKPSPFRILLLHFSQRQFMGIDSLLSELLKNNIIKPEEYVTYKPFLNSKEFDYYSFPIISMNDTLFTYKLDDSRVAKVNKLRKNIGLYSIGNQIQKMQYNIDTPERKFRISPFFSVQILPNFPQSVKDSLLKPLAEWRK